ncbi:hypothetical protein JIG36_22515 [Actinoplanes sp. LDG1-06]|uniref:ABC transporter permease n=1 Tax=Paractinoplanes ovalisporus TaxID=2810368 RepID=A0ABS2AG29_9ACTN|nr:hypothetical protein [Actinoplanes ovalisporus]MBM2618338.1 hypothetical protein [Actinoplanes ovalisporus]
MTIVNAEFRKLATLPALRWTILLTWLATLLVAYAAHRAAVADDPIRLALRWTQAGFLILGVLSATQEYEPGAQIRATLLTVPRRLPLLAAKTATTAATAILAALPLLVATLWFVPATPHPATALYLVAVTLLGAACGTLTRNPLAAAAVSLSAFMVAFPLLRARFPTASSWLPDTLLTTSSPTTALATTVWAALLTAAAALTFQTRNA